MSSKSKINGRSRAAQLDELADSPEELLDRNGSSDRPIAAATRSTTSSPALSSERDELRGRHVGRVVVANAACLPRRTEKRPERDALAVQESSARARPGALTPGAQNSSCRRDLPTPASPITVTSRQRVASASSYAESSVRARSRVPPSASRCGRDALAVSDRDQPVRGRALGLALQLERLDCFDLDGVAHELVRQVAEQHLHRRGGLLQAGRDVDGVARHEPLPGGRVAGDDLAGVHAGPVGQPDAPDALELVVQLGEPALHLRRSPDRAEGIVLVQRRQAEDRHHGVPMYFSIVPP